jgi:hypothetical protein
MIVHPQGPPDLVLPPGTAVPKLPRPISRDNLFGGHHQQDSEAAAFIKGRHEGVEPTLHLRELGSQSLFSSIIRSRAFS